MSLIEFRCTACGTTHYIPAELAVDCPEPGCGASVGRRCRDLRSADPKKTRVQSHQSRKDRLPR